MSVTEPETVPEPAAEPAAEPGPEQETEPVVEPAAHDAPQPPTGPASASPSESASVGEFRIGLGQRLILALTALGVVGGMWSYTGATVEKRWLSFPLMVALLGVLATICAAFCVDRRRTWLLLECFLVAGGIAVLCTEAFAQPLFNGLTHTDEETFLQASAHVLAHGQNPYTQNFSSWEVTYHVPPYFATKLDAGGYTTGLNYPAGAVYALLPFLALRTHGHALVAACVVVFGLCTLAMSFLLPTGWRALGPALMTGSVVAGTAFFGASSPLVALPLVFVAWKWQETGRGGRFDRWAWTRAVALGVAASMQQVVWFGIPFVLLGVYCVCRGEQGAAVARRVALRFTGIAAGVFVLLNAPFIVWNPAAWFKGVLAPMFQHTLPEGQGLVNLAQGLGLGTGGDPKWFTLAGIVWTLALLVAFVVWFDKLRYALFALPALVMFAPSRSFMIYFIAFAPAWLMAAVGDGRRRIPSPLTLRRPRVKKQLAFGLVGISILSGIFALSVPQPLHLTIVGDQTSGVANTTVRLTAQVRNDTGHPMTPTYLVLGSNGMSSHDWIVASGPQTIPAHSTRTVVLETPDVDSAPYSRAPFKLEALTDDPPTYSVSAGFQAEKYATRVLSDGVTLKPGVATQVKIQLTNAFDETNARRAGVPVYLEALFFTPSNHAVPYVYDVATGKPVAQNMATTDANGIATFTLTSREPSSTIIYLRAHLESNGEYNGYSALAVVSGLG